MLKDSAYWDVAFVFVNEGSAEIGANKCVLCNRSSYFNAMLRNADMIESRTNRVEIHSHSMHAYSAMLEFLYTARVKNFNTFDSNQCLNVLYLATEHGLDDLKILSQHAIGKLLNASNICKMFCVADSIDADVLMGHIKVILYSKSHVY